MSAASRIITVLVACGLLAPGLAEAAVFPVSDEALTYPGPSSTYTTLDFDGDGGTDFVWIDDRLRLVRTTPSAFTPPQSVELPDGGYTTSIAAADLTGDGRDELLAAFGTSGTLIVVRGRADGALRAPQPEDRYQLRPAITGYGRPTAIDLADVDADHDLDVVVGIGVQEDFWYPPNATDNGEIAVMVNDGHGNLSRTSQTLAVNAPIDLALVPVSGADPDLLVVQRNKPDGQSLQRFRAAPGAGFGMSESRAGGELAWGDFDDDGFGDVLTAGATLRVLYGPDLGSTAVIPGMSGSQVAVGDLDADGRQDVYVAQAEPPFYGGSPRPVFLRNIRGMSFVAAQGTPMSQYGEWRPTVLDFDHDGKLDVLTQGISAVGTGLLLRFGLGPQLMPSPRQLEFDDQAVGTSSAARIVTFTNEGGGRATGIEPQIDLDGPDFAVDARNCTAATLEIGQSCTVSVRFVPTGGGLREAQVALFAADSDIAWTLEVAGRGFTRPPATPTPSATPIPTATATATPAPAPPAPLKLEAPATARVTLRGLLRNGLRVRQRLPVAGRVRWTLETAGRSVLATAVRSVEDARVVTVTLRLTARGRRVLERRQPRQLILRAKFTDTSGRSATSTTRLKRASSTSAFTISPAPRS